MTDPDDHTRASLLAELATWLGPSARLSSGPRKLCGGESSDCYVFELANPPSGIPPRLVLRLMNADDAAARECAIQNAAEAAGFPVPHIYRVGISASVVGRPFSIMAFVEGRDPVRDGSVRRIPETLANTMLALHGLPTENMRASITSSGVDVRQSELTAAVEELRRSERPEIARAAQWLGGKFSGAVDTVLCHGDLHPNNLLMHSGRVVAVIDWEIALFAPRAYDVARTELVLLLMPGVGAAPIRPIVRLLGKRLSRQFRIAYTSRVLIEQEVLNHCRALHILRLVALLRTPGLSTDGVRTLWRPFEKELSQRWFRMTGIAV